METLKGNPNITLSDTMVLNNYNKQEAHNHLVETKRHMGLTHWNSKLSVKAYCDYYGIDYEMAIAYLNPYREDLKKERQKRIKSAKRYKKRS